ncbi:Uncharacterised protein [Fusobacterium ulcerans]|uniref:TIR domain-containing protein n=2 Tax=Fusobacterium ulcerans TaxID=861 RepID=A0AAX2J8T7_9FUSO|nr:toll/interleukin-1 receptor domain-containing protein [Fusobacterium ulcerans]SQJ00851.1 Uncharacterised protein [Fusobacterium ulcerans]
MNKKIFLSYCQKNKEEANSVDIAFKEKGIIPTRDERDLKYKQSLEEFMKQIREHDFALLLISHDYLLSENCMYELLQVLKEKEYQKKILPLILIDNFFDSTLKISYIKKWVEKINQLEQEIKNMVENGMSAHISEESKKLKKYKSIENEIGEIITNLQKCKMITFIEGEKCNFETIFAEIGLNTEKNILQNGREELQKTSDLFSENKLKTNIGMPKVDISFRARNPVKVVKEKEEIKKKGTEFGNEREKFKKGIVDDGVVGYIEELINRNILCKFIIKYGDDYLKNISLAIIKLEKDIQKKVMINVLNNHESATGYNGWSNYDFFGTFSINIYESSNDAEIKELSYQIIKNCARYRQQFEYTLECLEADKYL